MSAAKTAYQTRNRGDRFSNRLARVDVSWASDTRKSNKVWPPPQISGDESGCASQLTRAAPGAHSENPRLSLDASTLKDRASGTNAAL
jgi:hypothetical protein